MNLVIHVRLLNEGVDVYRPVPAIRVEKNLYLLRGENLYCPEDEKWEFLPGSTVTVEEKILQNGKFLVAISEA